MSKNLEGVYREREFRSLLAQVRKKEKAQNLKRYRIEYEKLLKSYIKTCLQEKRLTSQLRQLRMEIKLRNEATSSLKEKIAKRQKNLAEVEDEVEGVDVELTRSGLLRKQIRQQISALETNVKDLKEKMAERVTLGKDLEKEIQKSMQEKDDKNRIMNMKKMEIGSLLYSYRLLNVVLDKAHVDKKKFEHYLSKQTEEIRKMKELDEKYTKDAVLYTDQNRKLQQTLNFLKKKKSQKAKILKKARKTHFLLAETKNTKMDSIKENIVKAIVTSTELENIKRQLKIRVGENAILEVQKIDLQRENDHFSKLERELKEKTDVVYREREVLRRQTKRLIAKVMKQHKLRRKVLSQLQKVKGLTKYHMKQIEVRKFNLDELKSQEIVLNHKIQHFEGASRREKTKLYVKDNERKNFAIDVSNYRTTNEHRFRKLVSLKKECEKYQKQDVEAEGKLLLAQERFSIIEMTYEQMHKSIDAETLKKRDMNHLVETVEFDRKLLLKKYEHLCAKINQTKKKFQVFATNIAVRRKELKHLDDQLQEEHTDLRVGTGNLEKLHADYDKVKKFCKGKKGVERETYQEVLKLKKLINQGEVERDRQLKELGMIVNDRDMLGTQLVTRNQECMKLYEGIKLLQTEVARHRERYKSKLEEIEILKHKTTQLKEKLLSVAELVNVHSGIIPEVVGLRKDYLTQQNKIAFLMNEMDRPINVHVWRRKKEVYDLMKQKEEARSKLLEVERKLSEVELKIQEKERLYIQLKMTLKKQPTMEDAKLNEMYKANVKKKKEQWRKIERELKLKVIEGKEEKSIHACLLAELEMVKKNKWNIGSGSKKKKIIEEKVEEKEEQETQKKEKIEKVEIVKSPKKIPSISPISPEDDCPSLEIVEDSKTSS